MNSIDSEPKKDQPKQSSNKTFFFMYKIKSYAHKKKFQKQKKAVKQAIPKAFKWAVTELLILIRSLSLFSHQFIMAGATVIIAYFAFQQTNIIEQQNSISQKQNRISQDIADISGKILKTTNRAYISISKPVFEEYPVVVRKPTGYDIVKTPRVKYVVKNSGNTPALNVSDSTYFGYLGREPEIVNRTDTSRIYFYAPGDNIRIKTLDRKNSGRRFQEYFYGRIEYFDIFGIDHWITFCFEFIETHGEFIFIEKCNQTDKN